MLLLCVLAALFALAASPSRASGQPAPAAHSSLAEVLGTVPEGLSASQIDAIVAVLTDTQSREALRLSLGVLAGPPPAPEVPVLAQARARLLEVAATLPLLPQLIRDSSDRDAAAGYPFSPALAVLSTTLVLLGGLVAAGVARRATAVRLAGRAETPSAPILSALVADLVAIAAFAVFIVVAYLLWGPVNPRAPALLQSILSVFCSGLAIAAVARLLLGPTPGAARWTAMSDAAAADAWRWVRRLVAVALLFAYPVIVAAGLGLPDAAQTAARLVLSIAVIATTILMVWSRRAAITGAIGARTDPVRGRQVTLIAAILTFGLLLVWVLWAVGQLVGEDGVAFRALGSLLVLFALPLAVRWIERLLPDDRSTTNPAEVPTGTQAAGALASVDKAIAVATAKRSVGRMVRAVAALLALWLILAIWGIDPTAGEGALPALTAILFRGGVVVVLGYLAWMLLKTWIDRQIARARTAPPASSAARVATLLPILRATLLTVIFVIVTLSVLSSLGIAIGPLLAGAGVVGLAIGFGAQSLVRDIVSGFFFLLDDAFRVGEYVDTGRLKGTVEGMSLRSLRLRHHRGAVHTLPFGQIAALTNHSRDWVIDKLELGVTLDTDMAKVKAVLKQVGRDMAADPAFGPNLIEAPKSQGVARISDFAIVVGVKFTAKPGQQFTIRRELYRRIMEAFKANAIRLAYPTVTIEQPIAAAAPEAMIAAAKTAGMSPAPAP